MSSEARGHRGERTGAFWWGGEHRKLLSCHPAPRWHCVVVINHLVEQRVSSAFFSQYDGQREREVSWLSVWEYWAEGRDLKHVRSRWWSATWTRRTRAWICLFVFFFGSCFSVSRWMHNSWPCEELQASGLQEAIAVKPSHDFLRLMRLRSSPTFFKGPVWRSVCVWWLV